MAAMPHSYGVYKRQLNNPGTFKILLFQMGYLSILLLFCSMEYRILIFSYYSKQSCLYQFSIFTTDVHIQRPKHSLPKQIPKSNQDKRENMTNYNFQPIYAIKKQKTRTNGCYKHPVKQKHSSRINMTFFKYIQSTVTWLFQMNVSALNFAFNNVSQDWNSQFLNYSSFLCLFPWKAKHGSVGGLDTPNSEWEIQTR